MIEEAATSNIVWMPAHTNADEVGVKRLSEISYLIGCDRFANDTADALAKAAVEQHRVPAQLRSEIAGHERLQEETARWIAEVTILASNSSAESNRDTMASRSAAMGVRRARGVRSGGVGRGPRTAWARGPSCWEAIGWPEIAPSGDAVCVRIGPTTSRRLLRSVAAGRLLDVGLSSHNSWRRPVL